jgi:cytochrome c oxidase assembly protein subunit 15
MRARRLPFVFQDAAWVHSLAAILFIGLVLGLLISIWKTSAPEALQLGVRRLVIISLLQGLIGAAQYVTHVPVVLVELHIAGAVSLAIGVTQFHLRQTSHDREPLIPKK